MTAITKIYDLEFYTTVFIYWREKSLYVEFALKVSMLIGDSRCKTYTISGDETKQLRWEQTEDSLYIHGQNNNLALMNLQKATIWNFSSLQPLTFFYDTAIEKTYRY